MSKLRSLKSWLRRSFSWSNSVQSWQERLTTIGLIGVAAALWYYGGRFTTTIQSILWGVLVLLAAVLLRRGWLKLFGPMLFYDMVTISRRGRYVLMRTLYSLLLFCFLFGIFLRHLDRYGGLAHYASASRIAQDYFEAFMVVQLIAVLLLTPAYVAGSIADEKTRRTLEFILATDLRNREIVLSKLGSRLANLTVFILTGLPILSFLQFLGGVDPNLVLAGFVGNGASDAWNCRREHPGIDVLPQATGRHCDLVFAGHHLLLGCVYFVLPATVAGHAPLILPVCQGTAGQVLYICRGDKHRQPLFPIDSGRDGRGSRKPIRRLAWSYSLVRDFSTVGCGGWYNVVDLEAACDCSCASR